VEHPDHDDPFWVPLRLGAALDRVQVPVLIGGCQHLFVEQALEQYQHLRG
jgi:predicted acyl esterase